MAKKVKKATKEVDTKTLEDNKSLVSMTLRKIADEYDTLVFTNDYLIKENKLLEREVQILLKELDFENSESLRKIIRAKALLMR